MLNLDGAAWSGTVRSEVRFWGCCVRLKWLESLCVRLNVRHSTGFPVTVPCTTCHTPRNWRKNYVSSQIERKIVRALTLSISKSSIAPASGHCPVLNWNAAVQVNRIVTTNKEIAIFTLIAAARGNKTLIKFLMLSSSCEDLNWTPTRKKVGDLFLSNKVCYDSGLGISENYVLVDMRQSWINLKFFVYYWFVVWHRKKII